MRMVRKIINLIKIALLLAFVGLVSIGAMSIQGYVKPPVEIVQIERAPESLEEILKRVPAEYGVPEIVARAIVEQESNGKMSAIRFEPSQMERARKITNNPEQQRMYASSHCAFQVMGWWTPEYQLKWSDLYDAETCANLGMAILKKCADRHAGKSKSEQWRGALKCYNGSDKYAVEVLDRIEKQLFEREM